nr:hypothetical protein [Metabacillus schmidteae]
MGKSLTKKFSVLTSTVMLTSMFSGLAPLATPSVTAAETATNNLKFDFGSAASPVAEGYNQVANTLVYSTEKGYGFSSSVDFRDRGEPDALLRDFALAGGKEFKVDVPNGEYTVRIKTGDQIASNRTSFSIEGKSNGSISSSAGKFEEVKANTEVTDGQLNIAIGENGRINSLEIIPMIAPDGLEAVDKKLGAESSVSLKWNTVDGAKSYNIYRKLEEEQTATKIGSTENGEFIDTTAQLGLTYTYTVTQINEEDVESTPSNEVTVNVYDEEVQAPNEPSNLVLSKATNDSVEFKWKAIEDAVMYYIYRSKSEDGSYSLVGTSTKPTFVDSVATTTNFYYKIRAVNVGGFSKISSPLKTPIANTMVRQMEELGRDLVAVKVDEGVFISWRLLGTDSEDTAFNLYRDGKKVNDKPITSSTNFVDSKGTVNAKYEVREVIDGKEQQTADKANVLSNQYFDIPLQKPEGGTTPDGVEYTYNANDASIGDLDGDGEYEIILKWDPSNSKDNSKSGYTGNVYIDAYKLDGTRLWRLDLGKNIRAGAHYTQFLVYDFDGNGKSEIVMKTADGTKDGQGTVIGDADADYRNSGGYVLSGPEYLTVFEGATGKALTTTEYDPARGNVSDWGDGYGNRVDRFLAGVAYLDGKTPSIIMARGYYTRAVLTAYNFKNGELTKLWNFDSNTSGNEAYRGQGNHSMSIADVDFDGKDEIIYGAAAIDHDGTGLHTTGWGHGDAQHVSDLDPTRPGLEIFGVHENSSSPYGLSFRDGETGEIIWGVKTGRDTGRGVSADVDPRYPGAEAWAIGGAWNDRTGGMYSAKGEKISTNIPTSNFAIWWDGDLLRELLDHDFDETQGSPTYGLGTAKIDKWNPETNSLDNLVTDSEVTSNNWTKGNPALQADLLGDWREEAIWRLNDSSALRVYTTTAVTEHRIPTLMHDSQYRVAIAWQNVGYNQPPHPSYFLGQDMEKPQFPAIHTGKVERVGVQVNPEVINVKSKGGENSVTIKVDFTSNNKGNIKAVKLHVNGKTIFGNVSGNSKKATIKVNRQEIIAALDNIKGEVEVSLTGYLDSGVTITGSDRLTVK